MAGRPATSLASRNTPLLLKAWATPLGSLSWRTSGRLASSLSTVARNSLDELLSSRTCCRALSKPCSDAWRLCWVLKCWVIANCSWRPLNGTNVND
ncbi:hypothetical protein D3C80_1353140 [compost metagenome]